MDLERGAESWRKFFVLLSGSTNGAQSAMVEKFKSIDQIEVSSVEESDYILFFSPITSQPWTDINEALQGTEGNKPLIQVVMHHSSNPDHVIANSSRPMNNPIVHVVVVDFVFHEGHLLNCERSNTAWREIQMFLQTPASQGTENDDHARALGTHIIRGIVAFFVGFAIGFVTIVVATQLS